MITLEEAKAHCRVEHAVEDALIQSLISAAFRQIESRTGQSFEPVTDALMVLDALPAGRQGLELEWTPVRAIKEIAYQDAQGVAQALGPSDVYLDSRGVYPLIFPAGEDSWPESKAGKGVVTVTADIGYESLPADVRAAALLIVGHLYENREAVVIGTIASELPLGVEMLLAPYVIHRVG